MVKVKVEPAAETEERKAGGGVTSGKGDRGTYMCASFEGTMSRSAPTSACPVARIRRSPFLVSGSSVVPVCRPFRDHSVSPWRMIKARGVTILDDETRRRWLLNWSESFDLDELKAPSGSKFPLREPKMH